MDLLYTSTDIRCWSKVLCTITLTLICDLEVKIIDVDIPYFFIEVLLKNPYLHNLKMDLDLVYTSFLHFYTEPPPTTPLTYSVCDIGIKVKDLEILY